MKKIRFLLILVLGISLASSGFADQFISDETAENIIWPDAFYDFRAFNTWSFYEGGAEGRNGAYFQLTTGIETKGLLTNYGNIVSVKAEHEQTKRQFHLVPDGCTTWMGNNLQFWSIKLRPAAWMYSGTWKYILTYVNGQETHRQTASKEMGTVTFPIKPSYIQMVPSSEGIMVSWSGIGNPYNQNIDYRIRIFDENYCGVADFRGDWSIGSGTYDPVLNKVIFNIPLEWSRNEIRIENIIRVDSQTSRASRWTSLP